VSDLLEVAAVPRLASYPTGEKSTGAIVASTAAFSTVTVWEARQFEAAVCRLGEDGEPLLIVL
jgi:hypothetical protein